MERKITNMSLKILLNAESFGFGPTSAIADFFPHLRSHVSHLGFIGTGHALDLQHPLPYDIIHDITKSPESFESIVTQYDIFVTALDFNLANRSHVCGIPTIIYDPLTWFWPKIPSIAHHCKYISQGFYGVEQRLKEIPNSCLVPPLVPVKSQNRNRSLVLMNLGGLQNPLWKPDTAQRYAACLIKAFKAAIQDDDSYLIITSSQIAHQLDMTGISVFSRPEVNRMLPQIKYGLMTPGLANIYDAAAYNIPTLFVPPANDSQGQQLRLLIENKCIDQYLDWETLTGQPIDYKGNQLQIIKQIEQNIHNLEHTESMMKLAVLIGYKIREIDKTHSTQLETLLDHFGRGGAAIVAKEILDFAQQHLGGTS